MLAWQHDDLITLMEVVMSDQNKTLVRRLYEEVANNGNYDAANALVHPDYIGHSSSPETETVGVEGYKQFFKMLRSAFPDLRITIEEQVAEDDRVVTRWTARATHRGEFMGIPASGKHGAMTGINIERVVDGKVAECWSNSDDLGLLKQIGALPQPAEAS
jgi:steroid delta-isomerase-like uncharacterized protein